MPQIYIMATITLVIALALWGGLIYLFSGHQKSYFWLLLLGLPLSAIANVILKPQIIALVARVGHIQPGLGLAVPAWFLAFSVLVTPIVEEAIKVLPLLLRPAWKLVTSRPSALWVGFALGVSFGLGEAAFLAYLGAQNPAYASLPWYAYKGYFIERLFTSFAHGVLTAVLVTGIQRGGRFILYGYLAAVSLHLFINTPGLLYQMQWISLELYKISVWIPFIVLAVIFEWIRRTAREPKADQNRNDVVTWQPQDIQ